MSSLHKKELSSDQKGVSRNVLIETALMEIRWKLRFLAEALPDWLQDGMCPTEDAANGIGRVLYELADHVEAVAKAWEAEDAE